MTKPVVVLHRRRHRARRARRWATPAPSSRAARARPRPRWRRSRPPACRSGQNPTEAGELMVEVVREPLSLATRDRVARWHVPHAAVVGGDAGLAVLTRVVVTPHSTADRAAGLVATRTGTGAGARTCARCARPRSTGGGCRAADDGPKAIDASAPMASRRDRDGRAAASAATEQAHLHEVPVPVGLAAAVVVVRERRRPRRRRRARRPPRIGDAGAAMRFAGQQREHRDRPPPPA